GRHRDRRKRGGGGDRVHGAVESHQQRLTFDVREAQVQVAREAVHRVTVQVHLVELCEDQVLQTLAQTEHSLRLVSHALPAELARLAEADDRRDVERAGPHAALVPAALFAYMIETSTVLSVIARRTSSGSTMP